MVFFIASISNLFFFIHYTRVYLLLSLIFLICILISKHKYLQYIVIFTYRNYYVFQCDIFHFGFYFVTYVMILFVNIFTKYQSCILLFIILFFFCICVSSVHSLGVHLIWCHITEEYVPTLHYSILCGPLYPSEAAKIFTTELPSIKRWIMLWFQGALFSMKVISLTMWWIRCSFQFVGKWAFSMEIGVTFFNTVPLHLVL